MSHSYKVFTVKLRVLEGSQEHKILEFLNNKALIPYDKSQMILVALKAFWLTLCLFSGRESTQTIQASFAQSAYLWKLQQEYLKQQTGIELDFVDSDKEKQTQGIVQHTKGKTVDSFVVESASTPPQPPHQAFSPFGNSVISDY
ncbi:hypothetical protein [Nostoc sp. MG11]|uniref:hypothetical protein n=1 Tax=Nostoc sp. MG11 TaxID=2721166 RepID=UPI00186851DA|nr:hypothetical protein [Nostoc sp. MG11]